MQRSMQVLLASSLLFICLGLAGLQLVAWGEGKAETEKTFFSLMAQGDSLPQKKTIPIMIEGTEEKMVLYLHQAKPLGFYTYVPRDMIAKSNGRTFTVNSRFQGKVNQNVKFQIIKMGHSLNQAESQLKQILKEEGFQLKSISKQRFGFAKREYALSKTGFMGRAAVFQYNGRYYVLYYFYPPEYADGFEPRLEIILDELVWYDSIYK